MEALMNIRFACPNDLDFIYNSLVELFTEAQVIERFSQTKISLSQILFSMTNRNFPLFDGPGLYLHDLYVKEHYRRMGIATELISQLKKIAKERSCTRIDWVLLTNNKLGQNFYNNIESAKAVEYLQYMRINCEETAGV